MNEVPTVVYENGCLLLRYDADGGYQQHLRVIATVMLRECVRALREAQAFASGASTHRGVSYRLMPMHVRLAAAENRLELAALTWAYRRRTLGEIR